MAGYEEIQGARAPIMQDYELRLAGLPSERDGITLVAISDLHLGTLKGKRWLTKLLGRVNDLKPDLVVIVGDLVDGKVRHAAFYSKTSRTPIFSWSETRMVDG